MLPRQTISQGGGVPQYQSTLLVFTENSLALYMEATSLEALRPVYASMIRLRPRRTPVKVCMGVGVRQGAPFGSL